jgi:hypothetical protein
MAIGGIGAMLSLGGPQASQSVEQTRKFDPAGEAQAKAASSAERQKRDLDEVREKGLYAWVQEKKFEALREKIEKELKAQRGLDDASLAAMSPEARDAVMTSLEEEISKRIQEVMQNSLTEEAQKAAKEGRPAQPMIIDIAV